MPATPVMMAAARPILPWLTAKPANIMVASAGMGMHALSMNMSTKMPGSPNTVMMCVHQLTRSFTRVVIR